MITLKQAINLGYGSHVQYINHQGRTIRLKINGLVCLPPLEKMASIFQGILLLMTGE